MPRCRGCATVEWGAGRAGHDGHPQAGAHCGGGTITGGDAAGGSGRFPGWASGSIASAAIRARAEATSWHVAPSICLEDDRPSISVITSAPLERFASRLMYTPKDRACSVSEASLARAVLWRRPTSGGRSHGTISLTEVRWLR